MHSLQSQSARTKAGPTVLWFLAGVAFSLKHCDCWWDVGTQGTMCWFSSTATEPNISIYVPG